VDTRCRRRGKSWKCKNLSGYC